jgi:hypothetical protein
MLNPKLYESKDHAEFRDMSTPWRILEKGYMEREYSSDDEDGNAFNEIAVIYVAHGPFEVDQNIYASTPVQTRTELMTLLQRSGYKKPLILDFSCGNFDDKFEFTPEMIRQKRDTALDLNVGGTKRKSVKRRSFIRVRF